jgi:NADPH:quinone reductase-like Zn-dependent oxidoreductase
MEESPRDQVEQVYARLAALILNGGLRQKVDSAFTLENFREALFRQESHDRQGKILFRAGEKSDPPKR